MSATCRIVAVCGLVLLPAAGWAQSWEVEVHGGGAFVNNLDGSGTLPAPGAPFATPFGNQSRRVSSWYFGDGARLLNDAGALFTLPQIAPLDPVLTGRFGDRGNGRSLGVRVGRALSPRVGVEFNLDVSAAPVTPTDAAIAGIDASNASFVDAFQNGLLAGMPTTTLAVGSEYEVLGDAGQQVTATGALTINLTTQGRVVPYATFGGGVIVNRGDMPSASIDGSYSFDLFDLLPFGETDGVRIRHEANDTIAVGLVGGGVRTMVTRNSGIRADVRVHVGSQTVRTLVSASPGSLPEPPPGFGFLLATAGDPSVQISNRESFGPSSLSGPAITDFESFKADGLFRQVLVSVGYFWRF